jgi:hypothetical protein
MGASRLRWCYEGPVSRRRRIIALLAALTVAVTGTTAGRAAARHAAARTMPARPAGCAPYLAQPSIPPVHSYDPRPRAPRIFAIQFKQAAEYVTTYAAYRAKIDCMLRAYVLPHLARGRPNVVAFNEDVGLATVATGSRGAAARNLFAHPGAPSCESQGVPCGTIGALAALTAAYSVPLADYHLRFPSLDSVGQVFVAATDTTVRSFLTTFSELAKRYRLYLIGSADLPPFRESTDATDLALLSDPDLHPRPKAVYVATAPQIYDEVFMWGPRDVRTTGPGVLRNAVAENEKVPLTPIENEFGFSAGPATGPAAVQNLEPYALPGTRARIGFATSLPAFTYGSPPPGTDPCSNTSLYYMRCLDTLGANIVIQDEANPGRWTGPDGNGMEQWQPLAWMSSTYRAVSDPSVRFFYDVTPMMVGNLADLAFDGQSAITQRGLRGAGCHYIGNAEFVPGEDQAVFMPYAGSRPRFLAIAPWVVPDGPRAALRAVGAQLAPGSHAGRENEYLETALIADLPFPPDRRRHDCASAPAPR